MEDPDSEVCHLSHAPNSFEAWCWRATTSTQGRHDGEEEISMEKLEQTQEWAARQLLNSLGARYLRTGSVEDLERSEILETRLIRKVEIPPESKDTSGEHQEPAQSDQSEKKHPPSITKIHFTPPPSTDDVLTQSALALVASAQTQVQ